MVVHCFSRVFPRFSYVSHVFSHGFLRELTTTLRAMGPVSGPEEDGKSDPSKPSDGAPLGHIMADPTLQWLRNGNDMFMTLVVN